MRRIGTKCAKLGKESSGTAKGVRSCFLLLMIAPIPTRSLNSFMTRKLRIEYEGAVYHVINRGNYRADIFEQSGAKAAFLKCLDEACQKSGWIVHAWVIMRNHYHLALETPRGNLVPGMHWLQATFSARFNRFRKENGHLFQGRYKAILVEPDRALGSLCQYIHLNPIRAKAVRTSELMQ